MMATEIPNAKALRPFVPLPRDLQQWKRKTESKRSLNDLVEELHLALWSEGGEYCRYHDAIHNEHAVEGSTIADDFEAARILRDAARQRGIVRVSEAQLYPIVKALKVVLSRYDMSRHRRRKATETAMPSN